MAGAAGYLLKQIKARTSSTRFDGSLRVNRCSTRA